MTLAPTPRLDAMGLSKHAGTCAAEGLESREDLGVIVEVRTI